METNTRKYNYATAKRLVVGASSVVSAAIEAQEISLQSTVDCLIKIGRSNPVAADGDGVFPLNANTPFHEQIDRGDQVAVIQKTAGGFLYIRPVR